MGRLNDISLATQVAVFGNKRAFDQLVREYQSPVRRFLLNLTLGNEALSDDLAQDTFLKAYTHISQYRGTSTFLTWLTRIAYNVFYDYKRKEQAHTQPLPAREGSADFQGGESAVELTTPLPHREGLGVGLRIDLYHALSLLKLDERTCITLQLIDGYDIAAIAKIMELPAGTVKSHLKRGKEKMANYLRKNGYDG